MRFDKLAERQILKAQAEGQMDDLKGAGKPLPRSASGDTATEAGFRIMADAGVVPKEFSLKAQVIAQREALKTEPTPEGRKAAMAKLADLEMRYAIEQEARRKFLRRD